MSGPLPHLEEIDLSSEASASLLIQLLSDKHALPESLSVLGNIVNSFDRTRPLGTDNLPTVQAWCTEPLSGLLQANGASAPPLFSVFTYDPSSQQFRFFCSAEVSGRSRPPTPDENDHVEGAFRALHDLANAQYPRFHVLKSNEPAHIVIGAVHEKWRAATEIIMRSRNPCPRYLLSPNNPKRPQPPSESSAPERWIVSQMQEHDIPTVSGTSHIPRSAAYLRARFPYSVCVRDPADPERRAIAWALIHSDGGVGTLYVDDAYRKQGLGKRVVRELGRMLDPRSSERCPLAKGDPGSGAAGWMWSETMQSNVKGQTFFNSMSSEGWELAWTCDWIRMGNAEK